MSYTLPLKVRKSGESYQIVDARGRSIYLYAEDSPLRQEQMQRWSSQEAEDLCKLIARFLTERADPASP